MQIKTDNWFPSPVWSVDFTEIDNQKIADYAQQLKHRDPIGAANTNYNGWQSKFLDSKDAAPELLKLASLLNSVVEQLRIECGYPPLHLYNIWININNKGSYNSVHNHRESLISGGYYVRVPLHSGNIEFYRNDEAEYYIPSNLSTFNHFNSTKVVYESKDSQALFFPSWMKHGVQGSNSEEDRISVAFNFGKR